MGRSGKRTDMRGVERRGRQPRLAADDFVYSLHRRPVRWDLLVYRLAGALSTAYWRMRTSLSPGGCRFDSDDLPAVGLMLAKGFEVVLRRILRDEPEGDLARLIDAGTFGAPQAEQLAARVAGEAFEPLLRKYAEDVYDVLLPRPDNDLSRVVRVMSEALSGLLTRAADPADKLAATLTDPLAAASPDLPDNLQPRDPAPAGASRARDILLLAPTIHASDDAGEAKRKLVHFTHNDPWLFAEASNYVLDRTEDNGADEEDDWDVDPGVARFGALDDFLYRATRVGGRTPIELFVERQPDPEAPQCRRMLRWSDEAFAGLFQVKRVSLPRLWLKDLEDDREYESLLHAARGAAPAARAGAAVHAPRPLGRVVGDVRGAAEVGDAECRGPGRHPQKAQVRPAAPAHEPGRPGRPKGDGDPGGAARGVGRVLRRRRAGLRGRARDAGCRQPVYAPLEPGAARPRDGHDAGRAV